MASVTQKIRSYVGGISEQPDEIKASGQVVDLNNGIPDVTRGCMKRPGSKLIAAITPSEGIDTRWFGIYRDESEQYIGEISNRGVIKIWRCSDGVEIPVDYSQVTGTSRSDYLDNSIIDSITITNAGSGYSSAPTIAIGAPPSGTTATATCTILGGVVNTITMTNKGSGYLANPSVTFSGGGGSNAAATANILDSVADDIQPLTINETVIIANRTRTIALKTDTASKSPQPVNEAFIAIDTVGYGKQYALDIYDPTNNTTVTYNRATSLVASETVNTSGITNYSDDGKCVGMSRETVQPSSTNSGTPYSQGGTGKSNLRYEMDTRCQPVHSGGTGADINNYDDSYQPFASLQFGGEGWSTNDTHTYQSGKGLQTTVTVKSHSPVTARANIALVRPEPTASTAEESVTSEVILNGMKANLDAISGTGITATIVGTGIHLYRATPFNISTTERRLMNIITDEANTVDDLPKTCRHGYIVRIVNSGEDVDDYYLKFNVDNIDPDIDQRGTYSRSTTVSTITANAHGLANGDTVIVKFTSGTANDGRYTVANSTTNTFTVTTGGSGSSTGDVWFIPERYGKGVWEECAAPNIAIEFDKDTMPIKLVRETPSTTYANGRWVCQNPAWDKRQAGDDITNPQPSFVGYQIEKMAFFRNRIVMLSAENTILSRVNDFYNFWAKTALSISNTDPIDLQSSSTFPTKLYDAVEANSGLVLFSSNQQFLLNSGADALLTPETAKISYLSSYAYNKQCRPFSLGASIGFLNNTGKNARFYEMANIQARGEPDVLEQSKVISQLFPKTTTLIADSLENDMVLFGTDPSIYPAHISDTNPGLPSPAQGPTNDVWGYRYFNQGNKRLQSAWFRWELPNTLIFHTVMDDGYYFVAANHLPDGSSTGKYTLERIDLKTTSQSEIAPLKSPAYISGYPEEHRVFLDTKKVIEEPDMTYNATTDETTFTLGAGFYSIYPTNLRVFTHVDGDKVGRTSKIKSITGTAPNQVVTLDGNWATYVKSGSTYYTDLIIGYDYEYEVELPTLYLTKQAGDKMQADNRASLILHRLNFGFGPVGLIDVTLKRRGRADYTKSYESVEWDSVLASTWAMAQEHIHTIPVYDRNTNLSVHLKSTHPSPCTLFSMNWEGDYSPKFYNRV